MENRIITQWILQKYKDNLTIEEKSTATAEKYCRDIRAFSVFIGDATVTKEAVIAWK